MFNSGMCGRAVKNGHKMKNVTDFSCFGIFATTISDKTMKH
jgi:hypothetical protein